MRFKLSQLVWLLLILFYFYGRVLFATVSINVAWSTQVAGLHLLDFSLHHVEAVESGTNVMLFEAGWLLRA